MHCYGLYSSSNQPRRVNQSASEKTISSVNESSSTSAGQSFNHSISKLTDVPTSQGVKQTIASPRASEDGVMLGTVCQHMTAWSMLIYFVMSDPD